MESLKETVLDVRPEEMPVEKTLWAQVPSSIGKTSKLVKYLYFHESHISPFILFFTNDEMIEK